MTVKFDKLPKHLQIVLVDKYGGEAEAKATLGQLTPEEVFNDILEWLGIINYGNLLWPLRQQCEAALR